MTTSAPDWYQKRINALQLNGMAERSQQAYTRALRMLMQFYDKCPEDCPASSACSTPGAANCNAIPTFTTWSPAAR
jgi:hypothetical protein